MTGPTVPWPIARVWTGSVPLVHAEGFHRHLLATGVADAEAIDGCLGAIVLRRGKRDRVRYTLLTLWRDRGAERRFCGIEGNAAVLYPGDEAYGLIPDRAAVHHEVLLVRVRSP